MIPPFEAGSPAPPASRATVVWRCMTAAISTRRGGRRPHGGAGAPRRGASSRRRRSSSRTSAARSSSSPRARSRTPASPGGRTGGCRATRRTPSPQSPAPGTRVLDTGMPTIRLPLANMLVRHRRGARGHRRPSPGRGYGSRERASWTSTLAAFAFAPGLALGSFLNVVAARVPLRRSLVATGARRA